MIPESRSSHHSRTLGAGHHLTFLAGQVGSQRLKANEEFITNFTGQLLSSFLLLMSGGYMPLQILLSIESSITKPTLDILAVMSKHVFEEPPLAVA